jgi:hypothetical protein
MPEQFTVPQFIDAEDKIFGPITARQFVILILVFMTDAILYRVLPFFWFIGAALPIFAMGVIIAFAKINGVNFHFFILNLIQTLKRPRLRVWDKKKSHSEIKLFLKKGDAPPPPPPPRKAEASMSRLAELSLIVNTGGVYTPEE